jgi:hypothetical protein
MTLFLNLWRFRQRITFLHYWNEKFDYMYMWNLISKANENIWKTSNEVTPETFCHYSKSRLFWWYFWRQHILEECVCPNFLIPSSIFSCYLRTWEFVMTGKLSSVSSTSLLSWHKRDKNRTSRANIHVPDTQKINTIGLTMETLTESSFRQVHSITALKVGSEV